ncbi:MAG: hypothetical protein RL040_56 [Bacteroidota bacterium]|jgi:predicted O-methyltransferase YrrM
MSSNRWHEAKAFVRHYIRSKGPHGVHSPFVYRLITHVLRQRLNYSLYEAIEKERRNLMRSNDLLEVQDYGAGSRVQRGNQRMVKEIARNALQSSSNAKALAILAEHSRAKCILELGTSLGITTAHLAAALPHAKVFTIEGCPNVAAQAKAVWGRLGIDTIDLTVGSFSEVLENVLKRMPSVDFVIIDGDHRGSACREYLEAILPFTHNNTVVILDDIYWSPSMTEAWQTIIKDKRFSLTLDFFDFGVLYQTPGRVKEHFELKRAW